MERRPSAIATGILEWAARAPERAAFVDARRVVTLGELEASAAALAARLLDGAGPKATEGSAWLPVVVDRSTSSALALHGAIRAGCAWAPIESTAPREFVAELCARLGNPTRAVVAQPEYAGRLPAGVEPISAIGHASSGAVPPQPVDHDAPGAVVFTSGTTARPKGVVLPWPSLDSRVERVMADGPHPDVGTWREGFVQPFGFAAALRAIALPSVGRTLCIADPNSMSVDDLLDWLDAQQIDRIGFPPSLSTSILRVTRGRPRLSSVSLFSSGAEASDWALVEPLRKLIGPHVTIRAGYATSEAGSITRFTIGPDDPIGTGRIPMGRLEPGVEVRLERLEDDPSLTELWSARPRSLGYLGDPELTDRRYVTDENGVVWWKSGDIVQVDDAGVYHHHGRADELVKVHGMFVAPSRVEQELRATEGIGAAAVIATPSSAGKLLLVAHVRIDDDTLTPESLHEHLRRRLPRLLMPAIVVRHDDLPLTARHKLDRRALEGAPLVRWRSARARVTYMDLERWCLEEVRRIVGIDDIGPDDDLFEAGLDSLAALELCGALADAGFDDVDPSRLLQARTCARLCATLERTSPRGPSTVVAMNDAGSRTPVFVLPGGGGTALKFRFLAELLGVDRPLLVIEPRGMHRPGRVDRSMTALADHVCEEVEARLGVGDLCILLGYSASGAIAYEAAQRLHASGRPVHLVLLDAAPVHGRSDMGDPFEDDLVVDNLSIRNAAPRELPGAVMRSARFRSRKVRRWWFTRFPGRPRYSAARYSGFRKIMSRASTGYEPAPAEFSATLIHIGTDDLVARTAPLVRALSVQVVGGDHHTMLEMPEVVNLARIIAEVTDAAMAQAATRTT